MQSIMQVRLSNGVLGVIGTHLGVQQEDGLGLILYIVYVADLP